MRVAINWTTLGCVAILVPACSPVPLGSIKTLPAASSELWAPQDFATNIQDWNRAAKEIADGLQNNGLLPGRVSDVGYAQSRLSNHNTFFLSVQQESVYLRQLKEALETEITHRGGTISDQAAGVLQVDLRVDVVQWGSRLSWQSGVLRREAVWQATLVSGGKIELSFREPFYIYDSDLPLYERVASPAEQLANTARPLRYRTQ